jgi:UDP-N-acetylmuramoyl-tripeptide--D-alanyl-D-alanine ligase
VPARLIRANGKLRDRLEKKAKLLLLPLGGAYRRHRKSTQFIAITGSCGKTTTKFLIRAALAARFEGVTSPRGRNRAGGLLHTLFQVRRHHRFCLVELGAFGPGTLDELITPYQPDIGVVTNVGQEHLSAFRNLDAIAEEKVKLVRALPSHGWAILNGDDPKVRQMAAQTSANPIFFGREPGNDLIGEAVSSRWPDRLSFVIRFRDQRLPIETQLCGEHWVYAVLAALGVALAMGLRLEEAIEAVAKVKPFTRRMQPVQLKGGITWIRDDWKASSWTIPLAFDFLGEARVRRRIFVLGQVSDDRRKPRRLYPRLARDARQVADQVCLFGQWASHGLKARADEGDHSILAFPSAIETARHLEQSLEPGDLLYVKAAGRKDPSIDAAFSGEFWQPNGPKSDGQRS